MCTVLQGLDGPALGVQQLLESLDNLRAAGQEHREKLDVGCEGRLRRMRACLHVSSASVDYEQLLARLTHRGGHFMPPSLLDTQLADLEPPQSDEHAILIDGAAPTHEQVARVLDALPGAG